MGAIFDYVKQIDWKEITGAISSIAFLVTSIALLLAVFRVKIIAQALSEFRKCKSDLGGLLEGIERLDSITPKLNRAIIDLGEAVDDVREGSNAEVVEQKPSEQDIPSKPISSSEINLEIKPDVDGVTRWQEIRSIWQGARDKMESIIEALDGRRRRPYNQQGRQTYAPIADMLLEDRELTKEQADAAKEMDRQFHQLKPKNKSNTSEDVLQRFREWKRVFDA